MHTIFIVLWKVVWDWHRRDSLYQKWFYRLKESVLPLKIKAYFLLCLGDWVTCLFPGRLQSQLKRGIIRSNAYLIFVGLLSAPDACLTIPTGQTLLLMRFCEPVLILSWRAKVMGGAGVVYFHSGGAAELFETVRVIKRPNPLDAQRRTGLPPHGQEHRKRGLAA